MPQPCLILVVEDEPLIGMELRESLGRQGFKVPAVIASADLIYKAIEEHKPDLIIMDIKLQSYMDGIDAAYRVRTFSQVPIIFLTAYSNPETRNRAEAVHPVAFLNKPVSAERLGQVIREALVI